MNKKCECNQVDCPACMFPGKSDDVLLSANDLLIEIVEKELKKCLQKSPKRPLLLEILKKTRENVEDSNE